MTPAQQEAQRKHIEATSEWHEAMGQCQRATSAKNNADMKLAAAKNKLTKAEADVIRALSAGSHNTYGTAIMNDDDICKWPDGMWCYWHDLPQYAWKSDDYRIIKFDSAEWHDNQDGE